jgi:hypothetical protein
MTAPQAGRNWLVLVFQFPKGAGSERVKIWRRLQSIGAVAIKNSMYVLPRSEQAQEDFEWLVAELTASGAETALLESLFISGLDDPQLREMFNTARNRDYAELKQHIDTVNTDLAPGTTAGTEALQSARQALVRSRKRLADIEAIDFFGAPELEGAQASLWALDERLAAHAAPGAGGDKSMTDLSATELRNRVWVTRRNVRVDRIASAWLIRRWIDPDARFRFVDGRDHEPGANEVRFDMFEAEFTHQGDRCTLEVLARHVAAEDDALRCVGEIVHDIDLKDHKFGRPETEGVASLLSGLVASLEDDERRIERGSALFEDLYQHFRNVSA